MHRIYRDDQEVAKGNKKDMEAKWDELRKASRVLRNQYPGARYRLEDNKGNEIQYMKLLTPAERARSSIEIFLDTIRGQKETAHERIVEFEKELNESMEKGHGYTTTLNWKTEGLVEAEEIVRCCDVILGFYEDMIKETEDPLERHGKVLTYVKRWLDCAAGQLARAPWKHNCTSAMSNLISAVKAEALGEMYSRMDGWYRYSGDQEIADDLS